MKIKKLLSIILTVCMLSVSFSSVVQISAKTDIESSSQITKVVAEKYSSLQIAEIPFEPTEEFVIRDKDDFDLFITKPVFWERNYKVNLACDIDMKGKAFKPIKEFSGKFDGCGHTISNMLIKNSAGLNRSFELAFIKILNSSAEIKNVNF